MNLGKPHVVDDEFPSLKDSLADNVGESLLRTMMETSSSRRIINNENVVQSKNSSLMQSLLRPERVGLGVGWSLHDITPGVSCFVSGGVHKGKHGTCIRVNPIVGTVEIKIASMDSSRGKVLSVHRSNITLSRLGFDRLGNESTIAKRQKLMDSSRDVSDCTRTHLTWTSVPGLIVRVNDPSSQHHKKKFVTTWIPKSSLDETTNEANPSSQLMCWLRPFSDSAQESSNPHPTNELVNVPISSVQTTVGQMGEKVVLLSYLPQVIVGKIKQRKKIQGKLVVEFHRVTEQETTSLVEETVTFDECCAYLVASNAKT